MLHEGQELGNYRVVRKIGTGGMGQVYLAEHPVIGKKVALKVIHRDLAAKPEVLLRFSKEAKAVGMVAGDHVVDIHDFGTTPEGDCYYVMDYLEGKTLAHALGPGRPLGVKRALYIGAQLAEALAAVHRHGVLHRDLKPDNIMLVEHQGDPDYVMLLDFGLAKFLGEAGDSGPKLTAQGMILGTPQYMSPEAAEAKADLDHRADQYSAGVLLFQMLTGQLPFDGESMAAILVQQVSKPPPPLRGLNSHVPPAVEQLVLRALAKDPGDRYPDMEALRRAILDPDAYLASQPPIMPTSALLLDDQETVDVETSDQRPETRKTIGEFGSAPAHARVTEPEVTAVGEPVAETTDHQITAEVDSESGERGPAAATVRELSAEQAIHLERLTAVPAAAVGSQPRMPATASAPGQPSRPVPAVPENKTMGIATPLGFIGLTAPPPKKRWPAVVALAAVTVVIVAMVALATRDSAPAGAAADASLVGQATADAAPEAPPLPETVKLSVVSTPPGVEVFDQDGKRLGVTPMECRVPRANETRTLRLVHPDLVEREKTYDASQDIAIDVELTRRPRPSARSRRHRNSVQSKSRSKGDELLEKAKSDGVLRPKL